MPPSRLRYRSVQFGLLASRMSLVNVTSDGSGTEQKSRRRASNRAEQCSKSNHRWIPVITGEQRSRPTSRQCPVSSPTVGRASRRRIEKADQHEAKRSNYRWLAQGEPISAADHSLLAEVAASRWSCCSSKGYCHSPDAMRHTRTSISCHQQSRHFHHRSRLAGRRDDHMTLPDISASVSAIC